MINSFTLNLHQRACAIPSAVLQMCCSPLSRQIKRHFDTLNDIYLYWSILRAGKAPILNCDLIHLTKWLSAASSAHSNQ